MPALYLKCERKIHTTNFLWHFQMILQNFTTNVVRDTIRWMISEQNCWVFLPLASGIAILGSLTIEQKKESIPVLSNYHFAIGIFGLVVTFGLLIYELKGIEKCSQFIKLGRWLETQMGMKDEAREKGLQNNDTKKKKDQTIIQIDEPNLQKGFFIELANGKSYINEPIATAIIYPAVLSLWTYIAFLVQFSSAQQNSCLIMLVLIAVFLLSFFFIYFYWNHIVTINGFKINKRRKEDTIY